MRKILSVWEFRAESDFGRSEAASGALRSVLSPLHPLRHKQHHQPPIPYPVIPTTTMPRQAGVLNDVLDAVGHTPLVRLDRIAKHLGLRCNLCMSARLPGS